MKNFKNKSPEFNVEYTFRYPGNKIYTFVYEGTNANGRLAFWNKTTNNITDMRTDRFSYLHRFQLVSEKPIEKATSPKKVEDNIVGKPFIDNEYIKKKEAEDRIRAQESEKVKNDVLNTFSALNDYQKAQLEATLKTSYKMFFANLTKFFSEETLSHDLLDKTTKEILKASEVLNLKLKFL